ncbi:AraC family transcriptional regulator [Paenibacillus sp. CC-CFT747]|nr:AraC family transcriptional regulator [Paenibacillus sp. CC-CFT747]
MVSVLPVYQDAKQTNFYRSGQLPLYVLHNVKVRSPLHYHDFAELSLVIEGLGSEKIHGKTHTMRRGTVSFLMPHHIHEIQSHPETPIVLYSCMFDLAILTHSPDEQEWIGDLLKVGLELPSYYQLNEKQTREMESLLVSLKEEYEHNRYGRDVYLRTKLTEALLLMLRCHLTGHTETEDPPRPKKRHIGELVPYVHQHYNEPINLREISQVFHSSSSSISRLFKQVTGQNFTVYLHTLRIHRALSLLASTDMSVTDIAEEVGFQHTRSFSRVFKEIVGMNPKQYRVLAEENRISNP